MASELLKTKALAARIKEPKVRDFDFGLNLTSVESLIPDLPEPKPQELLDLQEKNKKQRLLQALQKIGGGLEDSSLDFIKRQNFSNQGLAKPKRGLVDEPGSYAGEHGPYIYEKTLKGGKRIYELEVREQIGGKRKVIRRKRLPRTEDNLKILKNIRDTDPKLAKYIKPALYADDDYLKLRFEHSDKNQKQFADFLNKETDFRPVNGGKFSERKVKNMDNRTKYISQTKFRIPESTRANIIKDFKTGKYSMMELGREYFPDDPVNKFIKGQRVRYILNNEGLDTSLFKNEQIDSNKSKYERQYKRKREITRLLKKAGKKTKEQYFTLENQILAGNEEILKLSDDEILSNKKIMNALNVDASKDNLAKGKITFDKYKNLSPEEQVAKVRELAKKRLFIQPEHIRSVYTGQQNIVYPNNLQSAPGKIGSYMENIKEYVRKNPDGKAIPEIEKLFKDYDMGVDEGGKKVGFKNIIYNSKKGSSNIVDGGLFKVLGEKANIKKLIAAISPNKKCQGKFNEGGSTNLDFCFTEGKKAINEVKIKPGAQSRNFAKFANRAYKLGRGIMKFGVIPEALFVGAESLIRMNLGDTLDESLYRAADFFISGNQTDYADVLKTERTLGGEAAEVFRNVTKWKRKNEELQSLEQAEQADLALAGTDFAETNSGVSADETRKTYAGLKNKKRKEILDASVSKDDQVLSQSYLNEAYDISKAKSTSAKIRGKVLEDESGLNVDLLAPEKNQQFQRRKNFREDIQYGLDDLFNEIESEVKQGRIKNEKEYDTRIDKLLKEKVKFRQQPLSDYVLKDGYTPEEVYGAQEGRGFLNKINREKFIRPGTYEATPEEIDANFDMQDGIMAAEGGRIGYGVGGITKVYQLLRGVNKTKPLKGLEEKLIKQYKSEGMEFIEAIKKAQTKAAGIRYESKMKIIDDSMKDTNVYSDDYVDLLDMKIKLEDPDFAKDYMNFSETLKNKIRAQTDEGWAEANFGENYSEQMDIARSKEINESIDSNFKEPLSPSDQMASDIDDMNKANIDDYFGTRKKQASGGLTRIGFAGGSRFGKVLSGLDYLIDLLKKKTITVKRGESGTRGTSNANSISDYRGKYYTPEGGGFETPAADARYYSKLGGDEGSPKVLTAELTPEEIKEGLRLRGLDLEDPEIGDIILPKSAEDKVKIDYLNTIRAKLEKYLKMAEGGRINFGAGSGPMSLKIIYIIMDRLRNLKNSTFSNYNQVRMYGEQKGITELLEPFKNIPNKNRITSTIDDAEELKKFMPDEYKSILDEIIDDTKQFKFKTAHDKQQALEKALPKELKFENLPEEMFPMPNPENPNFIVPYGYPDKNPFQKSRNLTRTEADKFTGKGTRKTYDTFNEKTKQYQEPSKNTLISEEPIDEELESIIRDLDKGNLQ